jgi:hypothetical protein
MASATLTANMIKTGNNEPCTASLGANMITRKRAPLNPRAMDPANGNVRSAYQSVIDQVVADARDDLRYHLEQGIRVYSPDDETVEPWQKARKLRGL